MDDTAPALASGDRRADLWALSWLKSDSPGGKHREGRPGDEPDRPTTYTYGSSVTRSVGGGATGEFAPR